MYKCAFVIPYFGKLPEYFSEWLQSVKYLNRHGIDFIIISDAELGKVRLPENVKLLNMTFQDFKKKIQSKFDFEIFLDNPYKICDYRPAFGYIFDEELKEYDFWGNCDLDQVWGNIPKFLSQDILDNHEKILYLGHCSLYRNNSKMNTMFMNSGGMASYREVFSSKGFYAFDEFSGMVAICKAHGVKTYYSVIFADIAVQHNRVTLRRLDNYKNQLIYFHEGSVYRSFINPKGNMITEEYLYFHFQKKNPKTLHSYENNIATFYMNKDNFVEFNINELSVDFIKNHCDFVSDDEDRNDEKKYKKNKIMSFMKSSWFDKKIWMRRKISAKTL